MRAGTGRVSTGMSSALRRARYLSPLSPPSRLSFLAHSIDQFGSHWLTQDWSAAPKEFLARMKGMKGIKTERG